MELAQQITVANVSFNVDALFFPILLLHIPYTI